MNTKKTLIRLFAAALLGASMLAGSSFATSNDSDFAALQGVSAQPLSVEEMQAISGELNAFDIAAALLAQAATATNPRVAAALTALATYTLTNAVNINKVFAKFHILTP
jgi:hypothetical protein